MRLRPSLSIVKRLTEIQAVLPDAFGGAWLQDDGARLSFWAASGQYTMTVREAAVHIWMLRDNNTYQVWAVLSDSVWQESQTGEGGADFPG